MAFFGTTSGGAFGSGLPPVQIVGLGANLLQLSFDAKSFQQSVLTLPPSAALQNINRGPAVIPPWEVASDSRSLVSRIAEVRGLSSFIDESRGFLGSAGNDLDKKATFTIFKALDNLRALAQYAAEKATPESSLGRLDSQFTEGFAELRGFIEDVELDKLTLLIGEKENRTETSVRLGRNGTEYIGGIIQTGSVDDVVAGLTGTEVFDITLTKAGVSDTITIDLSQITGTLSVRNIVDFANQQISTVLLLDEFGAPVLDGNGDPQSKYQTRFGFGPDSNFDYGLKIEGTITEDVVLTPQASTPGLIVTGSVTRVDGTGEAQSFLQNLDTIDATITTGDRIKFSGIDLTATELKTLTDALDDNDSDLDPKIAALKEKFLADALKTATGEDPDPDAVDEEVGSITDLEGKSVVSAETRSNGVAVDSVGNIYAVGTSSGSFGHQINTAETSDIFLTKFDSEGNVIFSRLLGADSEASGFAITIDSADNVIIAGQTDTSLAAGDAVTGTDAFVAKFTSGGDEVFRYQLDTFSTTAGLSVTVDGSNNIILAGETKGAISATSGYSGGGDALVLQIDGTSGALIGSTVFGGAGKDVVKGVAIAADGNILVAVEEGGDAILRKLDATDLNNQLFSVNLGALGTGGSLSSLKVDGNNIYIAGVTTSGAFGSGTVNGSLAGGFDGFVTGLTDGGGSASADFTTFIGTSGTERVVDLTVDSGKVFVAGTTTSTFVGETSVGATDGFVTRLDGSTGASEDTQQFGFAFSKVEAGGVAFTPSGTSVLSALGLPVGAVNADQSRDIVTQTSARDGDYFSISFNGGRRIKITIDDGDGFDDIARKIRVAGLGKAKVTVTTTSEGEKLKIETVSGKGAIELIAGADGRDALRSIGIEPVRLLPTDELFNLTKDEDEGTNLENLGGVFALGLDQALNLSDKVTAKFVVGIIDDAISTIQRAFRSTEFDPLKALIKEQAKNNVGDAPPRILAQIANYQDALARLQAGSFAGSSFSI